MNKRPAQEPQGSAFKKHKDSHQKVHRKPSPSVQAHLPVQQAQNYAKKQVDYAAGLQQLPPPSSVRAEVSPYVPFVVAKNLPPLPEINDSSLVESPFRHKSASYGYDRSSTTSDVTYERLEFLGDAYLELFASRLIYHHFPALQAGAQSQVRELLVKNETLSEYARLYGFQDRVDRKSVV